MTLRSSHVVRRAALGQRIMRAASADQPDRVLSLIALAAGGEILPGSDIVDASRRMRTPGITPDAWLSLSATTWCSNSLTRSPRTSCSSFGSTRDAREGRIRRTLPVRAPSAL